MSSSSTEPTPPSGTAAPEGGPGGPRFLPTGRTGWLRLVVVVVLALAAILAPRLIATTGAIYTDSDSVSGAITATASISP
ncbi:hypothetical protein [Cellulomonas sp. SG140]|uniref:hypothetical protein n=1 Tax=Cellulomonas sp. SG140 TaxID=2976536 RepID=UPI0021E72BA8|nr:hypothetical protein [Cellulomonas sp. SG140]